MSIAILLLIVLSMGYLIYSEFDELNHEMRVIVDVNNIKSELANTMRDAIRLRAINLRNMLIMEDLFDRDEEMLEFRANASRYSVARNLYLELLHSEEEQGIFAKLDSLIITAQPQNELASEYLMDESVDKQTLKDAIDIAFESQHAALNVLDELVAFQKQKSKETLQTNEQRHQETSELIIYVGIVVISGTFILLMFIGRLIANRNQALEMATETKSRFLANMSHEIRTPLTAIIGFTRLIRGSQIDRRKKQEMLDTVLRNSEHLLHLINEVGC